MRTSTELLFQPYCAARSLRFDSSPSFYFHHAQPFLSLLSGISFSAFPRLKPPTPSTLETPFLRPSKLQNTSAIIRTLLTPLRWEDLNPKFTFTPIVIPRPGTFTLIR